MTLSTEARTIALDVLLLDHTGGPIHNRQPFGTVPELFFENKQLFPPCSN